ncbi:uncharacterized protein LOC144902484 isoform X2 [Branchiostoma floridae x Branchiostoma belcheri]
MRSLIVFLCSVALCSTVPFHKGAHQCRDNCQPEETCCNANSTMTHGCCPIPQATCCSDGLHCCPSGFKCDPTQNACVQGDLALPWSPKMEVRLGATITCPGGTHDCPENTTCCLTATGHYGCCPLVKAVCCKDNTHCCPSGYKCDESAGKCRQGNRTLPLLEKFKARPRTGFLPEKQAKVVTCPDGLSACKDNTTCCKDDTGEYGCCPIPEALCCDDQVHCCPAGFTCRPDQGKCSKGDLTVPIFTKTRANARVESIRCGDGSACPNHHTCCKTKTGKYGCCPLPNAVCCKDEIHCCPDGYTCDTAEGRCIKGDMTLPWLEKRPSKSSRKVTKEDMGAKPPPHAVICPDHVAMCPDNNTCCLLQDGRYGCCPEPHAVCCSDRKHCCPQGYTCDTSQGKCLQGYRSIPWITNNVATPVNPIDCDEEGKVKCPDKNTCCKKTTGEWGCCPLEKALCCNDHIHCCPHGTVCNETSGECHYPDGTTQAWVQKTPPLLDVKEDVRDVQCPDGKSACEEDYTCCKNSTGYSCCPFSRAVCCNDTIHCCPQHYTCNSGAPGTCVHNFLPTVPMAKKTAPRIVKLDHNEIQAYSENNVRCDTFHECPANNTCCKLSSGKWGCCPLPSAVCCDDQVHCCPEGTTCDVSSGKCHKGDVSIAWFQKVSAITREEVSTVKCDATHECPSKNTCCKLASGKWGCCPLPSAVCCSDHVHCCPEGTTCDVSSGKCHKGDVSVSWFEKSPARSIQNDPNIMCDETHECPSKHTCCKLASGQWGCCPLPSAVCCSDKVHCCPEGTTCDLSSGKCKRKDISIAWFEKVSAIANEEEVSNVRCDTTHECPSKNTCCKLSSGKWGCCPLPSAVCCSDQVHCCPEGTTCDVSSGKCHKGDVSIAWFQKVSAITREEVSTVKCDATHECPSKNTCYKLASGKWGCCPLPSAVCCSDQVHCCPEGTTCDVSSGKCHKGDVSIAWFQKVSAITREEVSTVKCDATHECPSKNTCCKLASGKWGCCPLPSAVCCSDHVHCCPEGTTCDVSSGKCHKGDVSVSWFEKSPARSIQNDPNIMCDETHECPSKHTCCKLASGQWGCCPLPSAVCCSDHVHCCPEGTTCDVSSGKCKRKDISIAWFEKVSAITKVEVSNVKCDSTHECPSKDTCCKLASGKWGCCPLPSAVCCSDHVHCCPEGTTCSASKGKCEKGDISLPWFEKEVAILVEEESPNIKCDSTHECKSTDTCCKLKNGQWGCCPLPKAVCCSDQVHCCPEGTTCSVSTGKCERGEISFPWFDKKAAIFVEESPNIKCDATHECKSTDTCCKLKNGQWGCCPLPKAVCCSDQVHCCPEGTTCSVSTGKCHKGDVSIVWFEKSPARSIQNDPNIMCDKTHECPSKHTCCKLASGQWGCCPLPSAVCCSDHVHCCPEGTTCDVSSGKCHKGDVSVSWFEKSPARSIQNDPNIMCDETHECPSKHTCCKLASGQWGCCPLPSAVCCSDQVHCCPEGTTCDVSSGKCNRKDITITWFEKVSAITKEEVSNVKCDSTHECPSKDTCCKLASGKWGCCPLPSAVCCSDHVHCCPEGTTCSASKGKCEKGDISLPWFEKEVAILVEEESPNIKCDATHECKSTDTCCKLKNGQWGCCPLPKAVCCSDQVHCCPEGTTCSVSTGKCHKGDVSVDWFEKSPSITTEEEVSNIKCDATHECPSKNTCCKLSSGQWGCCPLPSAVCCDDGVHCCPEGTTCSASKGKCEKGDISLPWFEKEEAIFVEEESPNIKCDATHECKSTDTCCKLKNGQWGCCPLPKAVCCSDQVHCCPEGTTCSVSTGKCHKGDVSISWFEKSPSITTEEEVSNVKCDDTHQCPSKHTCCKLASGQWGCCPLPSAVCCDDHVHCCPEGTTCDVSSGKCNRKDITITWFEKVSAITKEEVSNVKCDSTNECPSKNTCCKLASGKWGCCPLPSAVCCDDGVHCCPEGTTCSASKGKCEKGDISLPWFEKEEAIFVEEESPNIKCDATHECKSTDTCCKLKNGQWGCCPLPKAVCCSDQVHCCPHGTTCSVSTGKCQKGDASIAWFEKSPSIATEEEVSNVKCDATHECKSTDTCCKLKSGQWGCCPLPKAVCCSDQVHCCPHGTTCSVSTGKCEKGDISLPWFEKEAAIVVEEESPNIKCDATHECKSTDTCCKLKSGQWGCCPLPKAVCCSDQVHCCPEGTTCDVSSGKCHKGDVSIAWFEKSPSITTKEEVSNVRCDSTHECPTKHTCCKLASGQWGCCPLPSAVCCSDHVHCCPEGTTCDVSSGKCNRKDISIAWFEKVSAITKVEVSNVKCDSTHECPSKNTCCKLSSGKWGCCPLPSAVCCSDHVHCCPEGTTCSVSTGKCEKGDISLPWFEKEAAIVVEESPNIKCDATHECKSTDTCCKLKSGQWGCCPLPKAVCCSDQVHCCPHGTTCSVSTGKCQKGDVSIAWFEKSPSITTEEEVSNVKCDATHECPSKNTCCKLSSGKWGCCPLPSAVCCDDGVHCCPEGTTCSVSTGKCKKGDISLPWFEKEAAIFVEEESPNIKCDSTHECKSTDTCCKLKNGQWGCCPLPKAVCCSDQVHCCPEGTTCSVSTGKCNKGDVSITWFEKSPSIRTEEEVSNVKCDSTHECPSKNTCCKLSSGKWGCCPLPSAVCCDDGVHCCPEGTTCDVSSGKCKRKDISIAWFEKVSAITKVEVSNVKCDSTHECPSKNTCCKLASGKWGCCPLPSAVCCSDHVHCCPEGTTCSVSTGKCEKGDISLPWFQKEEAIFVEEESPNIKCDATHECKSTDTCCKLKSGQWGCCPLPKAVCCSDQVHCCPEGTTCSVSTGKCKRGDITMPWFEKRTALTVQVYVEKTPCPGGKQECPTNYTCCQRGATPYTWGCCDLPTAECCPDRTTCCPKGYHCDPSRATCYKSGSDEIVVAKQLTIPDIEQSQEGSVVCPGGEYQCPDKTTCCMSPSGTFGCCPISEAVCCADGVHCCPKDHVCDPSSRACKGPSGQLPWLDKLVAEAVQVSNIKCGSSNSTCGDSETCCKMASGQWGCCPMPKAVCCEDHLHCCPRGYTCDMPTSTCIRGNDILPMTQKRPADVFTNS